MGSTGILALPYPAATAPPNVPGDLQALAEAIEASLLEPPRCCAYQGTAATTLTTGVYAPLPLDTELYDASAMHSTVTATTKIVIARAGTYCISGTVGFATNATGIRTAVIQKNGATVARSQVGGTSSSSIFLPVYVELPLAVADYIELGAIQTSGGNLATLVGVDVTRLTVRYVAKS